MRQNTLRVRLLGPVDLQLDNQPLPPLDSARAESLLAYLLLHRDAPQPRQRLAFLLWPGSSEGQAQTNLRKVLLTLRRALPDADRLIEIRPRTLRWRPDAPLWLDVERFERAVADGRPAEAVGLYAGDLLEGRYDDWLVAERERLAGLHADALQRLARQHEQDHRWPEAIRCAERLIARDPLREEYHRLLIGFCRASGTGPGRCALTTCAPPRWKTNSASNPRRKPGFSTSPSWPARRLTGPAPTGPAGSPAPRRW
jgi:DNA-binding SARP family transcriptional activator